MGQMLRLLSGTVKMAKKQAVDIDSLFFEHKKLEALLKNRIGIETFTSRIAPNALVENYIYSRLLIDLFAIVDRAIDIVFAKSNFKGENKKSKLKILDENGMVYNYSYLRWYKEWRNEAAHAFRKIEYHELRQATDDVQLQLLKWGLLRQKYNISPYSIDVDADTYHYGAISGDIPILIYRITYRENGCNWEEKVNLSLKEYLIEIESKTNNGN